MEKYAFFLDIDGTLAENKQVREENIRTIEEAREKGHYVFVNTGRAFSFLPDYVTETVELDGFVCGLGADIRFRGKQVFHQTFSVDLLDRLLKVFWKLPNAVALFEGEECIYYHNRWFDLKKCVELTSPDDFVEKYQTALVSKISCDTEDKKFFAPFSEELDLLDLGHYYELAQKGINKGSSMLRVAKMLGIDQKHCVAMGDSKNDEDMLKDAGIAVVMENGNEEMKKIATFITDRVENAGVAKAINKIIQK